MASLLLRDTINRFRRRRDLAEGSAEQVLDALIDESDEELLAELFRAWDSKGIEEDEIFAIANVMRGRCTKVNSKYLRFTDIVGTGGSRSKTFNISTAAAFVVAGSGLAVAKHGNKAATSNSGSADVLVSLGIDPAVDATTAEANLNEVGICFLFAPSYHRLSATLGKVRRGLGFPTIFNCVGPLCNPASPPHQLVGVWNKEMVPKLANTLARLGTKRSWVVHGSDGLDEISFSSPTFVAEVIDGKVAHFQISPSDIGSRPEGLEGLKADNAESSATMIRSILAHNAGDPAGRKLVAFNAAAALHISGSGDDIREAFEIATESIQSGNAALKLQHLAEYQHR